MAIVNALTVDVEDYFHVSALAGHVRPSEWPSFESRVCRNTDILLNLFDGAGVRGTFFVLGWVAERFPNLVRRIHAAGHEIASHGYAHGLVYDATPETFTQDLRRAREAIGNACGVHVRGYRAPSFSITTRSLWALDALIDEGYEYDSSIYPVRHDRYGIPDWRRDIHAISRPNGVLWEVPGSTVRHAGINLPVGGGGYFRLLPYWWTRRGIAHLNTVEQRPVVFYIHPWEIDPDQPRIKSSRLSEFRHYRNLDQTEQRLKQLLEEFRFGAVSDILETHRALSAA